MGIEACNQGQSEWLEPRGGLELPNKVCAEAIVPLVFVGQTTYLPQLYGPHINQSRLKIHVGAVLGKTRGAGAAAPKIREKFQLASGLPLKAVAHVAADPFENSH